MEAKARGGGGLPPGLKNEVAVCKTWKFAETQNGDPYFTLTGIIKDNDELEGRRATVSWFINESDYATVDECLEQMANDLKLIYDGELPDDIDGLPAVLDDLCQSGRHFLFNTGRERKGGKAPNVFIQGKADGYEDEPQDGAGEDTGNNNRRRTPAAGAAASNGQGNKRQAPKQSSPPPVEDDVVVESDEPTVEEAQEAVEETQGDDYIPQLNDEYGYTHKGATSRFNVTKVDEEKGKVQLTQVAPKRKPKDWKALVLNNVSFEKLEP